MTVPFYKQKKDALDEVGISARQESHWRQNGLYEPEIGQGRFTAQDIEILEFLRHLIVSEDRHGRTGLGLSIDVVRRLLARRPSIRRRQPDGTTERELVALHTLVNPRSLYYSRYIDIYTGKFALWSDVFQRMIAQLGTHSKVLERWILTLVFLRLKALKTHYGSDPKVYQAHRDRLIERIREVDLQVRAITDEGDHSAGFVPALPDDPSYESTSRSTFEIFQDLEYEAFKHQQRIDEFSRTHRDDLDDVPF